ncbi:hypothetical protein E4S40_00850 [Algoriphagus kandeliae]|uniref:phosphoribosylglycinamide formyltransferase 1 n=1 Tax=Algoriphagus kandeliae TaxID=2562278 RepID=A0A4Y9QYR2_9BACT|nr:formyl transferase [Algoriphagus kandeliae]TFV97237.1 hypothetical protein E4S40_00850 [Algoriphagus kandeliae]
MPKIIILTGAELRHQFFRTYLGLNPEIKVIRTYCESPIQKEKLLSGGISNDQRFHHLTARNQSEEDFFGLFLEKSMDFSNPHHILRGSINDSETVNEIIDLKPDLLISYGCSIIKSALLKEFSGRFINLHLGLSPYYRGAGTNFWPLVNFEPFLIGATFMHIDEGIDTGPIIHQIRARIYPQDTPHSIGNRLIADATKTIETIIIRGVSTPNQIDFQNFKEEKVYRNKDFNEEAVAKVYSNLKNGMIENYLSKKGEFERQFPIFQNPKFL